MPNGVSQWLIDVLHQSSKAITAASVVVGFLLLAGGWVWNTFIADSVVESVQELNGTPQIVAALEDVTVQQRAIRRDVNDLAAEVKAITPKPEIVEYDELRTRAVDPCFRGETCTVNVRSRRTEFGKTCSAPVVIGRTFIDRLGVSFTPRRMTSSAPARQGSRWTTTPVDFQVPMGAAFGLGQYEITLRFTDCWLVDPLGKRVDFGPIDVTSFPALVEIQPKQEDDQ